MPARAWQRMLSGRRLDILDPSPLDIELEDVAHGLARLARWNGQTAGTHVFSVAQHSCLVEALAVGLDPVLGREGRLTALLHDAPEYVLGDVITPVKAAIADRFERIEERLLEAVRVAFGLPAATPAPLRRLVKRADRLAAWLEATRLAGFSPAEATATFGRPETAAGAVDPLLEPWPSEEAERRFLARIAACLATKQAGHPTAL